VPVFCILVLFGPPIVRSLALSARRLPIVNSHFSLYKHHLLVMLPWLLTPFHAPVKSASPPFISAQCLSYNTTPPASGCQHLRPVSFLVGFFSPPQKTYLPLSVKCLQPCLFVSPFILISRRSVRIFILHRDLFCARIGCKKPQASHICPEFFSLVGGLRSLNHGFPPPTFLQKNCPFLFVFLGQPSPSPPFFRFLRTEMQTSFLPPLL